MAHSGSTSQLAYSDCFDVGFAPCGHRRFDRDREADGVDRRGTGTPQQATDDL